MYNLDFLKRKKVFKKENLQPNLNLYWMIIFFLGFVVTLFVGFFGWYVFKDLNLEGDIRSQSGNRMLRKISKDRLNANLEVFGQRESKSTEIINSTSGVVDPSL